MLRLFSMLSLALLVGVSAAVADFQTDVIFSEQLGEEREVLIFLPPGYQPNRANGYPVVHILHGADTAVDEFIDADAELAIDMAMMLGLMQRMILVVPDGNTPEYWGGSFWVDSDLYGDFEKYVIHDVVNHVDANYNTDATPAERGLLGYSMGGFGAMHLAAEYPQMWAFASALAAPLDLDGVLELTPQLIAETDDDLQPPFQFDPDNGSLSRLMFSMAGALSPAPGNAPPVQFILNENGAVNSPVYDRWNPEFATAHVSRFDGSLPLYLAVGAEDELNLQPGYARFTAMLDSAGVTYTYAEHAGEGHELSENAFTEAMFWASETFDAVTPDPAYLTVLPMESELPPAGGELPYSARLINNRTRGFSGLTYWVDILYPDGSEQRVFEQTFNLPAGANILVTPTLQIAPNAPTGEYQLTAYVGMNPDQPVLSDGFGFSKLPGNSPAGAASLVHGPAFSNAETTASTASAPQPEEFELSRAYPNPFNGRTMLSVTLPEAGELRLTVHDILGREVASLHRGRIEAGTRQFTVDAGGWSSGLYFVRAELPGVGQQVQRITLVK